ncbi:hypothetical protein GJ672_04665 [Spiribacter sp. 2438]|uniref:DUF6231 family protein n=1 Tax=Spiribacter sp. 2438 TaxID=2666185 RepID=UPI0012B01B48|nr:DUF6231 family protein [Spiribacter sp. 2438]QGM21629.1 hypothetical protein GJ672_04665 [Spiribacter sp. 2438]
MSPVIDTDAFLEELLQADAPASLLIVTQAETLGRRVEAQPGGHWIDGYPGEDALPPAGLDLAIVDASGEWPAGTLPSLVSRLRDILARRVVILARADDGGELNRGALVGLGFHRLGLSQDDSGRRRWYEFDMAHYKVTPDWLNSRHWANPELWDKYRW